MTQEPQHVTHEAEPREGHDGIAAVAITLLAAALIVFLIVKII